MGLKQLIRRLVNEKEPERKLQDPEKDQKKMVRVDPLERIAALKAADWDLTILLSRTSGISSGGIQQWHITEVDPLTFYQMVSEILGGGAYRMEFRKPDATILRLEDSEKTETHTFTIAGKSKLTVENTKQNAKGGDLLQELTKEGSIVTILLKTLLENQGKPDEVLMELLKTSISGNGNKALDPTALLANVTETVVKLKEAAGDSGADPMQYISQFMTMMNQYNLANRPPVSATGSNSSGLEKFFESLSAAAPAFAPIIAGALASKGEAAATPAALPPSAPDQIPDSQTQRTQQRQNPAFAGSGVAATPGAPDPLPKVNPLSAFNTPDLGGGSGLSTDSAAFGAVLKLRYMIAQQSDPIDIASEMVDMINLIKGAKRVEGVWENYIDDPGQAFDEYAPLIPEWLEHPEYRTTCREAMVKAVTEYFEESDQEAITGDGEIETDDATVDQQPPIEPPAETPTDDAVERISNNARDDGNGIIDG